MTYLFDFPDTYRVLLSVGDMLGAGDITVVNTGVVLSGIPNTLSLGRSQYVLYRCQKLTSSVAWTHQFTHMDL